MRMIKMYINHSGIKGQRKGVRRFQYANKTYTPAGNERYRPKKESRAFTNAVLAGSAAAYIGALSTVKTGTAVAASTSLSALSADIIGAGAAVVAGLVSIPLPVLVLGVPIGAIAAKSVIKSGMDYIEELKDR